MKRTPPAEDTARVVALALGFFGTLAAIGYLEGVFGRLSAQTLAALGAFTLAFAVATYVLDGGVRAWVRERLGALRPSRLRKAPAKSPGGSPAAT